ncbi:MAG: hypothetical protein E6G58_03095 [Actinobacteria bacterium]|nr:MAG: hypothetical protein E6G58_03095 [Actinomycetota bacterium]
MSGRLASAVAMAVLVVWLGAGPALADGTYHTSQYAFAAVNGASIRSGFVENIHADGPNVYAHEQYVLNGGDPGTTYQVVLMIFPGDPTCSGTAIVIPTASLRTNAAGNGTAYHVFTPEDAGGLRGLTVGGMWFLVDGGSPAYATACAPVELD